MRQETFLQKNALTRWLERKASFVFSLDDRRALLGYVAVVVTSFLEVTDFWLPSGSSRSNNENQSSSLIGKRSR